MRGSTGFQNGDTFFGPVGNGFIGLPNNPGGVRSTVSSSIIGNVRNLSGPNAYYSRDDLSAGTGFTQRNSTNGKDLDALRALGERNYYEFSVSKGQKQVRVGNVTLAVKKVDPKHNRYTLDVMADDKLVEKKDRTLNEPIQIYMSGARQPEEIVVNAVQKDTISGYLATPKVTLSRR